MILMSIAFWCVALIPIKAHAASEFGGFTYEVLEDNTAKIIDCSLKGDIVIPERIDGYQVTELVEELFKGRYGVTSVHIPSGVKAFGYFDYIFSYCYDLERITVSDDNQELCDLDGVIYSKDMKVLYNYPIGSESRTFFVPDTVETICCTAFGNSRLINIYLNGMKTDWKYYSFYKYINPYNFTIYYKSGSRAEANVINNSKTAYGSFLKWDGTITNVKGLSLDKNSLTLRLNVIGESYDILAASIVPENASYQDIIWKSGNESIATVNNSGAEQGISYADVRGISDGTTTITASTPDGKYSAQCKVTVTSKVEVTGIELNISSLTIDKNECVYLWKSISPRNATEQDVIWTSKNTSVAKVNSDGGVTGVSNGTTIVTVSTTDGRFSAQCKVTVVTKVLGISLNKSGATLKPNESLTLIPYIYPADAANKNIIWKSKSPEIVKVTSKGVVTGVKEGSTEIIASTEDGGRIAKCTVQVKDSSEKIVKSVQVKGIKLNKTKVNLARGKTFILKATISPSNATNKKVTFSSSNKKVATVDKNGKIKGIKAGTVKITVKSKDNQKTAVCKVTVTEPVKSIKFGKRTYTVKKGKTLVLKPVIAPKNASNKKVTYKSSDKKTVTVDKNGKIKGIKKGKVKITVTTDDGNKKATCVVVVK